MISLFAWHADWLPVWAATGLNYFIPIMTALAVIHEIYYVIYLHRSFDRLPAVVTLAEETMENNLQVRSYDVRFDVHGQSFTTRFSENMMGNNLAGKTECHILLQREKPHAIFIDSFSFMYMNLLFALMLVGLVYYASSNPL